MLLESKAMQEPCMYGVLGKRRCNHTYSKQGEEREKRLKAEEEERGGQEG